MSFTFCAPHYGRQDLAMHMHPLLPSLVAAISAVLIVGFFVRRFGQPHVIAYLLVGIVLGPFVLDLFEEEPIALVGEIGVIVLLFFVGLEVDLPRLATGWKVSVFGTILQVAVSTAAVAGVGYWLDWPMARIVLIGFAISLSSTALVVTMLRQWKELDTDAGHDALGILIVQDFAIVPMLIVISLLGGAAAPSPYMIVMQVVGGLALILIVVVLVRGWKVKVPFAAALERDLELQLFGALLLCFAASWVTGVIGLSTPLGAFIAGLVVASAKETDWVRHSLEPFRVLLVAVFFVSVGMRIDLQFLQENWIVTLALIFAALSTNTLINAGVMRMLGRSWRTSFYVGALLSQIGEFSFVLGAIALEVGIIGDYGNQMTLGVIAGTIALGPAWIHIMRPLRGPSARAV
ncbi:MAG: CPA2 family monovalent cation:H+ antiporter-2 [Planctomycetota bacterium]